MAYCIFGLVTSFIRLSESEENRFFFHCLKTVRKLPLYVYNLGNYSFHVIQLVGSLYIARVTVESMNQPVSCLYRSS